MSKTKLTEEQRQERAAAREENDRTRLAEDAKLDPVRASARRRLEASRRILAEQHAVDPVDRFNLRMARMSHAAKRERQRIAHLVLNQPRPAPELIKPPGMPRMEWKAERKRLLAEGLKLEPGIEEAMQVKERWSHKARGTPETWERATVHTGALAQLHANGTIDNEQLEWAAEIANVYRSLAADVTISIASLEARVDQSRSSANQAGESIRRVRLHLAYGYWRDALPAPKQMVLDMIVGDAIGYTLAARLYRVHNRKAKRLLLAAIDLWPECVDRAYRTWSDDDIAAARDAA